MIDSRVSDPLHSAEEWTIHCNQPVAAFLVAPRGVTKLVFHEGPCPPPCFQNPVQWAEGVFSDDELYFGQSAFNQPSTCKKTAPYHERDWLMTSLGSSSLSVCRCMIGSVGVRPIRPGPSTGSPQVCSPASVWPSRSSAAHAEHLHHLRRQDTWPRQPGPVGVQPHKNFFLTFQFLAPLFVQRQSGPHGAQPHMKYTHMLMGIEVSVR